MLIDPTDHGISYLLRTYEYAFQGQTRLLRHISASYGTYFSPTAYIPLSRYKIVFHDTNSPSIAHNRLLRYKFSFNGTSFHDAYLPLTINKIRLPRLVFAFYDTNSPSTSQTHLLWHIFTSVNIYLPLMSTITLKWHKLNKSTVLIMTKYDLIVACTPKILSTMTENKKIIFICCQTTAHILRYSQQFQEEKDKNKNTYIDTSFIA